MRPFLLALALVFVGAIGLSSCVLPLATSDRNCVSYCTLLQGCGSSGAPSGDCNAWCTAFEPVVEHTGCKSQFDEALQCVVGEGTCEAASCGSQTQSYLDCTQQFCAANPTDSACPES
jgi:hypothetical protein